MSLERPQQERRKQLSTESAPIAQSPTHPSLHPNTLTDQPSTLFNKSHALRQASLLIIDALVLLGSTSYVYYTLLPFSRIANGISLTIIVGIWITLLHINGLYNSRHVRPAHQLAYDIVKTAGMSILAGSAVFFLIPPLSIPREVHWTSALLAGVMLLLWRIAHLNAYQSTPIKKRALFVGPTPAGMQIAEELRNYPESGYELVGFIENPGSNSLVSTRLLLGEDIYLPQIVSNYQIDSIILPVTDRVPESTLKAIADCATFDCEIITASRLYERASGRVPVQHITHSWFVSELENADRAAYRIGKRLMDISLSVVGLLATGLLFPLIALLIKLDSPGPIFYSQIRAGKNGRPFKIYKFRSMVHNAERDGAVWAKINDKRITKIGELLRKTRLDELPQLYNVLLGEMSLVGPRPERPEFIEKLAREIPFFNKRQMILPGLTGWAQVNYPYGASTQDALEKLQYDLYYIKNRSMFLDFEILLRTIAVVIKKQGAR